MISRQEAAKRLLAIREAEESFLGYVKFMHPEFQLQPFHLRLIDTLDKLEKGRLAHPKTGKKVTRVMINWPPRHGKSQLATWLFPAWFMGRNPRRHTLSTSYSLDLAQRFGDKVRAYVMSDQHKQVFENFEVRSDTRAKNDWSTTDGGSYYGCGIGGPTTGRPANLLLIDDPVKNRAEAESITYRNKVWDYYISSLENRKEPLDGEDPIEIVILTRWHPDDLAGRIMATEDWQEGRWLHLLEPAIRRVQPYKLNSVGHKRFPNQELRIIRSQLPKDHPMYLTPTQVSRTAPGKRYVYKEIEEALWPERFSLEELKLKERRNEREFAALYQQSPYVKGGNLLKSDWWRYVDPASDVWPSVDDFHSIIIACDTAFKKDEGDDYSVFAVLGLHKGGDIYLLELHRGRWEFPELKRKAIALNAAWRGRGLRGIYIEDKASGQSLIQELRRQSGVSVIPYSVVSDKVARVNAVTPLIEGGRVILPANAPWLDVFIQETIEFPSGTHDDMVDAIALGLDVLAKIPVQDHKAVHGPLMLGVSLRDEVARASQLFSGPSLKELTLRARGA